MHTKHPQKMKTYCGWISWQVNFPTAILEDIICLGKIIVNQDHVLIMVFPETRLKNDIWGKQD